MEKRIEEALTMYKQKRYEEALNIFEQVLEHTDATPAIYNNMAMCYYNIDNFDKAADFFIKALSLDNKLAQAYINLTDIYFRQKKFLEAIELLQNAVYYLPEDMVLKHYLARVYIEDCRSDLAIPLLDEIVDTNPENYDAHWDYGRVCFELGNYDDAIEHFEQVSQAYPNNELIFYQLAQSYEANDEIEKALSNYLKACAVNENFHPAFKKAGLIFLSQGDTQSAKEYFEDYLNLKADDDDKAEIKKVLERISKQN